MLALEVQDRERPACSAPPLFDAVHGHDDGSRLARWYPALCAGYDLIVCGYLARAA